MAQKALITIIDDDEALREAINGLLRSWGFNAEAFASAEDFLNSDSSHHTRCLITDVQMPGMSGLELHRKLTTSGRPVPTILITAYPDDRVRADALRAGVICYLAKPFEVNDLLACICSILGPPEADQKEP
jgi:FixJ family two-component response regulator